MALVPIADRKSEHRFYRGVVARNVQQQKRLHNPSTGQALTRQQKLELDWADVCVLKESIVGKPILIEHDPSIGAIGRVVGASFESGNNFVVDFELFPGAKIPGDMTQLSLSHVKGALVGVEVSVVRKGARPCTEFWKRPHPIKWNGDPYNTVQSSAASVGHQDDDDDGDDGKAAARSAVVPGTVDLLTVSQRVLRALVPLVREPRMSTVKTRSRASKEAAAAARKRADESVDASSGESANNVKPGERGQNTQNEKDPAAAMPASKPPAAQDETVPASADAAAAAAAAPPPAADAEPAAQKAAADEGAGGQHPAAIAPAADAASAAAGGDDALVMASAMERVIAGLKQVDPSLQVDAQHLFGQMQNVMHERNRLAEERDARARDTISKFCDRAEVVLASKGITADKADIASTIPIEAVPFIERFGMDMLPPGGGAVPQKPVNPSVEASSMDTGDDQNEKPAKPHYQPPPFLSAGPESVPARDAPVAASADRWGGARNLASLLSGSYKRASGNSLTVPMDMFPSRTRASRYSDGDSAGDASSASSRAKRSRR